MRKLCSLLMLCLMSGAVYAQTTAATGVSDTETVSPIVVYAFLILFFGGIIGVGVYMWKSDRKPEDNGAQKKS
jgi:hypothetical protein